MSNENKKENKAQSFVAYVLKRLHGTPEKKPDTGFGAALKRADNPATEYQSWEYLAHWCNLEKEWEKAPFVTVAAGIARSKPKHDGKLGIGKAIAACYSDEGTFNGNEKDSAKAKLRRLLANTTVVEICNTLRPLLRLIESRGVQLNYSALLDELLYFNERTRPRWAQDFYGRQVEG